MTFVIAMSRAEDFAGIADQASAGQRPNHAMHQLQGELSAKVRHPFSNAPSISDRVCARLVSGAHHWALARSMRAEYGPDDVIFCSDEAIGFPIAAALGGQPAGPKVAVMVHNIVRPRARAAIRLFRLIERVNLWLAVSARQLRLLAEQFGVEPDKLLALSDQTDLSFFKPGPAAATVKPIIMSVGLEQRDYRTLAAATADLRVEVRISGFSADARSVAKAFPPAMPANMVREFYDWPDLLALYRTASVVVVSLFPNSYAAGIQALMEAVACGRPVIVTRTEGLAEYLDRPDLVTIVPTGNTAALRAAIEAVLADPIAAATRAEAARLALSGRFDSARYVATVADHLRALPR